MQNSIKIFINKRVLVSFMIWVVACLIFLLGAAFTNSKFDTVGATLSIISAIIGLLAFSNILVLSIIKLNKNFKANFRPFIILGVIITTLTGAFIFSLPYFVGAYAKGGLKKYSSSQTDKNNLSQSIDCYIDGKLVKTTKNNCKELSKINTENQNTAKTPSPETNTAPKTNENTNETSSKPSREEFISKNNLSEHAFLSEETYYCDKEYIDKLGEKNTEIQKLKTILDQKKEEVDSCIEEEYCYYDIDKEYLDEFKSQEVEYKSLLDEYIELASAYCYDLSDY